MRSPAEPLFNAGALYVPGKQTPCRLRLLDRQIAEVVIGIFDPNRDIRGRGWWKFEERGVKVRNFDFDLVQEIREMNAAFINDQLGLGLMITQIQPEGAEPIEVTPDHRMKRKILEVGKYKNTIRGVYRVRPQPGDSIAMFVRRDRTYNPQAPIRKTGCGRFLRCGSARTRNRRLTRSLSLAER